MKTPWHTLYDAGDKLGDRFDKGGSFASSKIVGLFYFLAILAAIALSAFAVHLFARGSTVDSYFQSNFDTVLYVTAGLFIVYMIGRGFWDAFWQSGSQTHENNNG
ncbi:hypothetical protein FPZ24_06640 [Sphingomonas panacisoli]|uniref:Uncharacterized protein n=1 Tax=Sphingomonas panacisoli TaxID=1813879 RepID=A0A5B8LHC3_9SPHN|nr:hypothetical protein [Sphingomonas panacisoli]QDZ07195.1 hypothetical protein FPZ24_06640 [Sphingomonas panacisoli]